ncbi:MAG: ABC transporter ATP-binding protein [Kiritimatiellae bacterium]|nr:ABC transporter ATP-binding protein [Kiritimatiellia bacterium]
MLLEIDDLSVSYRNDEGEVNPAAVDVTLSLDRGQVLGIVGESGSGKSTVSMSVARLLPSPPAFYPKGRILFDGEDVLSMPLERLRQIRGRRIGVIFQDPMGSLSPLHRIGDQLMETVMLHEDMPKRAARDLVLEWLGKVGIPDPVVRARAYPHELSGGMQQRVMIAMGLMLGPDLVIADEPTTALDVTIQAQVLRLMRELHRANSAVLLITHDLGVVSQMATKLAVMKDGRVIETAENAAAFFAAPKHPYSQGLVREARRMELSTEPK